MTPSEPANLPCRRGCTVSALFTLMFEPMKAKAGHRDGEVLAPTVLGRRSGG